MEELKTIWQQYDLRLNNLEEINKNLIKEVLTKKSKDKLKSRRFRSIHVIILLLIVLIVLFQPYYKIENIDWQFIIGWGLTLSGVIYLIYINLRSFLAKKKINIGNDTIIESANKINNYKCIINTRKKYVWISNHLFFSGVLLIAWNLLSFNIKTIFLIAAFYVFLLALGFIQLKYQRGKFEKLEKEMFDLKEYEE